MIQSLPEKLVDYYTSRTIANKIIGILVFSGIALISQDIWSALLESWLYNNFNIKMPEMALWGLALILIGIFLLIIETKYRLVPSVFATHKTTRIIYLGNKKYQFVFDKKLRTTPTICFVKPSPKENHPTFSSWTTNGFIVEFEEGKDIEEIIFWADAWQGLGYSQKATLFVVNLFRSKDDKILGQDYENSFSNRQIERINNT